MPAEVVKSFANKTGKSVQEVEKLWNKAKEIATKEGIPKKGFFAFVTAVLKKMLGIKESLNFKDIYEANREE